MLNTGTKWRDWCLLSKSVRLRHKEKHVLKTHLFVLSFARCHVPFFLINSPTQGGILLDIASANELIAVSSLLATTMAFLFDQSFEQWISVVYLNTAFEVSL